MFIKDKLIEHKLIYIPIDASEPNKRTCVFFIIWAGIALLVSTVILFNTDSDSKGRWFFYLLGMMPIIYAFQDKKYVENTLRKDFNSLMMALYKGNLFFLILMWLSTIISNETGNVFLIGGTYSVFWILSIPLVVFYETSHRIIYGLSCLIITAIFVIIIKETVELGISVIMTIGIMLIVSLAISMIVSYKQIIKNFGTNKLKEESFEKS